MVRYKYVYDKYLEELDKEKSKTIEAYKVRVNKNHREIEYLSKIYDKMYIAYIGVFVLYALLLSPVYSISSFYDKDSAFLVVLIYTLFFILLYIGVFIAKKVLKTKIKRLEEDGKDDSYSESDVKYTEKQEEIYKIVLFIITINENYDYLLSLSGEKRLKEWKRLLRLRRDIINLSMSFKPNTEKYQRYFEKWLELNK